MAQENIKEVIDLKTETEKKDDRKNRIIASIGTFVTYAVILLLLLYFGFKAPDPPLDTVEGVAVVLGTTETGMNPTFEPVTPPQPQPKSEPTKPQEQEEIVTEEESDVTIPAVKKKEEPKPKEKPVEKEPEKKAEPEKEPERKVNEDLLFKPGKKTSKGTGTEEGDQGKKDGKADAKSWQGGRNDGDGFEIEGLGGRGLRVRPNLKDDTQREGKIVVEIVVDREGNVISARGGIRGTTINDFNMISKAEEAAKRTKFDPDPDAQEKQYGKITFNYKLE